MTKHKKIFFLLLFFFFMLLKNPLSVQASQYIETKNLLIINSYQPGFTWTDDQTKGILSSLSSGNISYTVSIEYLDWKRFPTETNLEESYHNFKYKYQNEKIDLILCTDDAAFSFVTKNRSELFSDAPVVFSGINSEGVASLGQGLDNFTGVTEVIDPKGTMEAALSINPEIDKIYLIYDNTESGLSTGNLCIQAATEIDSTLEVLSLNNLTAEEILDAVSKADQNTLILITTYAFDYDGDYIDHELFCKELGLISPVPLYHIYDFSLNSGIFGGHLTIGRLQGEAAGSIALRILNGESASSIPIITEHTNQYIFDYNLLAQYGLTIKDLPAGSVLINEPFSFVKTYKVLVITVLLIFIILSSFTLILVFYIRKISTMQTVLKGKNEELTQIYEELTASEEEIRHQYIELTNAHEQLSEYSEKLYHLAHHDSLTGLYNRLFMYEEVDNRLSVCEPECALYFIDIDNFKYINDALGHNIGDDVLQLISHRLLTLSSDKNLLIRLSGDEFVLIANHLENREHAEALAQKILSIFSTPFHIQGNLLSITASIGIAMFPENGNNVDTLLRNADMAMYKAKNNGKNGLFFFNQLIKDEVLQRINIEKQFQKALTIIFCFVHCHICIS
ncbi:MAG: diguanylate cyclase [Clostridiales bacterium]|nr:diguanylate cyclase [Clostridiales bacterium]